VDARSDPAYLQFRRLSVRLASASSVIGSAIVAAYAVATWDRPHRGAIVVTLVAVVALVGLITVARAERLVDTRWCDPFFAMWSGWYVTVITGLAVLDGGASSPLVITFFAPLVFAAACYPLRLALGASLAVLAGQVGIALAATGPTRADSLYVSGMLALTAAMCVWQAHTHDRQRRELALASRTDHLTGVFNRRGFHERADAELARAARSRGDVALVLVDLDGFKRVNDAHGHAAGDDLLRWVAGRLLAGLRPSDVAGRLGGDEFALLLPGLDARGARDVGERLRATLAERTSASFGTASAEAPCDADAVLLEADAELYRDKQRGRALEQIEPALDLTAGF
jgi:diguanylate cyclase (GGDEF)-like protein